MKQQNSIYLSKATEVRKIQTVRTGVFAIDFLTKGIPINQVTVLFGDKGCGKTTISYMIIDNFLKSFKEDCLILDLEHSFNKEWAEKFISDMDRLWLASPDYGEQAVDLLYETIQKNPQIGLIVIDSVAMLLPIAEVEGSAEDDLIASQARLIRKLFNKIIVLISQAKREGRPLTCIAINQVRSQIGAPKFGSQIRMPGGKLLGHIAYLILRFYLKKYIKVGGIPISAIFDFVVEKSKLTTPKVAGEFILGFDGSIKDEKTILEFCKKFSLIEKHKGFYLFFDQKFPTEKSVLEFITANKEKIKDLLLQQELSVEGEAEIEDETDV